MDKTNSFLTQGQAVLEQIKRIKTAYELDQKEPIGPDVTSRLTAEEILQQTVYGQCLSQLLSFLPFAKDNRYLARAMPHLELINSIDDLRIVLDFLGYQTEELTLPLDQFREQDFPIIIMHNEAPRTFKNLEAFSQYFQENTKPKSKRKSVDFYKVHRLDTDEANLQHSRRGWTFDLFLKLKRHFIYASILTLAANIITLFIPFYTGVVYDRVVHTKALETLLGLACIALIALLVETKFREIRSKLLSYIGARIEHTISCKTFSQVLHLPVINTEGVSVSSQIGRFRQFRGLREIFSGQTAAAMLDLPFAVVFCLAIGFVDPVMVLIPVTFGIIFFAIAIATNPYVKRLNRMAGEARNRAVNTQMELLHKAQTIHDLGAQHAFQLRLSDILETAAERKYASQAFVMTMSSLSQFLVSFAGICSLGIGTLRVMQGEMTVGALIAVMMLVWRVITPMQTGFMHASKISQFRETMNQIDGLMRMRIERGLTSSPSVARDFKGRVDFKALAFRYPSAPEMVLRNIALNFNPGELVAISGATGSGKSTLLKLVVGLYANHMGAIYIDGIDVRQLNSIELRTHIGYAPQRPQFFHGTILQNMRLVAPDASQESIESILAKLGTQLDDPALSDGIETRLTSGKRENIPNVIKSQLNIARAFIGDPPLVLLDEPGAFLDQKSDPEFLKFLLEQKGKRTIFMVTNRPSHMKICDRIVILHEGMVVDDDTSEALMPKILSQFTRVSA